MRTKTIVIISLLVLLAISTLAYATVSALSEDASVSVESAKTPLEELTCLNDSKIAGFLVTTFESNKDRLNRTEMLRTSIQIMVLTFNYTPEAAQEYVLGSWKLYSMGVTAEEAREGIYSTCMN